MKKITANIILLFSLCLVFVFQACDDEQPAYISFEPYQYASLDENGGTWTPNLLTGSSQIGIPAPADAGSPEFTAEVAAVKAASASLTGDQQRAVDYWGGDGLIRWNEIMRELSAKYNLAPAPNP
ncbi:MAG TPA: hypothetical protein VJ508_04020, partial [Saprospiraceae bacterium]|nr:hypothetical protein [Saprospiraceae bacterium]